MEGSRDTKSDPLAKEKLIFVKNALSINAIITFSGKKVDLQKARLRICKPVLFTVNANPPTHFPYKWKYLVSFFSFVFLLCQWRHHCPSSGLRGWSSGLHPPVPHTHTHHSVPYDAGKRLLRDAISSHRFKWGQFNPIFHFCPQWNLLECVRSSVD